MNSRTTWSRAFGVAGIAAMMLGAIDPLEGSLVLLAAAGLLALGAFLGESRYRKLLYVAFACVAVGVSAMAALSAIGGIGGDSGRSIWLGLFVLPYPVGWLMGVALGIARLVESFKRPAVSAP